MVVRGFFLLRNLSRLTPLVETSRSPSSESGKERGGEPGELRNRLIFTASPHGPLGILTRVFFARDSEKETETRDADYAKFSEVREHEFDLEENPQESSFVPNAGVAEWQTQRT